MISIITGTFNRLENIKRLISNTVDKNKFIELVIVDGGSSDGTIDYLIKNNNNNIRFINYGKRSTYSHFMNLAIENSTHEYICQWNDDALLVNDWKDIGEVLKSQKYDFHLFNWKLGNLDDFSKMSWLAGDSKKNGWNLEDKTKSTNEEKILTLNYGVYNKKIFREIGMYNTRFNFWHADGDLSNRAYYFGYKYKSHRDIKVFVLDSEKSKTYKKKDWKIYQKNLKKYKEQKLPRGTKYLIDIT